MAKLADPQCWLDAAMQIFFSFGLGFGGLIAFSSYNPRKNNCERDALIVSLTNWFTAIFACTVIFSILGFKATIMYEACMDSNIEKLVMLYPIYDNTSSLFQNQTLTRELYKSTFEKNLNNSALDVIGVQHFRVCDLKDDLNKAAEGTGLAFIAFTQAINEFGPSAPFWSIIFFLMLLSLGIGSEFGTLEGVTACIYDMSHLHPWLKKKWLVSGVLCLVSCSIGLLFVMGSGQYWVALFDGYAGSFPLITVGLTEAIAIGWVYGADKFAADLTFMIGHRPNRYWLIAWKYIAPFLIAGLLLASVISKFVNKITYEVYDETQAILVKVGYPPFAAFFAILLALVPIMCIPGLAILRKFGLLMGKDVAKSTQAQTGGHTASTVAFMRTQTDDNDSGHNSDELEANKDTSCGVEIIDEHVTFGLEGKSDPLL